jgi:hypothetical protein
METNFGGGVWERIPALFATQSRYVELLILIDKNERHGKLLTMKSYSMRIGNLLCGLLLPLLQGQAEEGVSLVIE